MQPLGRMCMPSATIQNIYYRTHTVCYTHIYLLILYPSLYLSLSLSVSLSLSFSSNGLFLAVERFHKTVQRRKLQSCEYRMISRLSVNAFTRQWSTVRDQRMCEIYTTLGGNMLVSLWCIVGTTKCH